MWIRIMQRIFSGIAWGGLVTFIAMTVLMINDITPDISVLWFYMLMSFMFGIYFGLASFIFVFGNWSPLKKTIIHFLLSVVVYFAIAIPIGWVPPEPLAILLTLAGFIFIYTLFWFGFNLYYKKLEASLNESLRKK